MRPFDTMVFRIRLLLLAVALGLMGMGVKNDQQAKTSVSKPTRILSREAPRTAQVAGSGNLGPVAPVVPVLLPLGAAHPDAGIAALSLKVARQACRFDEADAWLVNGSNVRVLSGGNPKLLPGLPTHALAARSQLGCCANCPPNPVRGHHCVNALNVSS
jgi:hypothetical protein